MCMYTCVYVAYIYVIHIYHVHTQIPYTNILLALFLWKSLTQILLPHFTDGETKALGPTDNKDWSLSLSIISLCCQVWGMPLISI